MIYTRGHFRRANVLCLPRLALSLGPAGRLARRPTLQDALAALIKPKEGLLSAAGVHPAAPGKFEFWADASGDAR